MTAHAVTLRLSAPLYDHFESRARQTHRSLEAELLEVVASVAANEKRTSPNLAKAVADLALLDDSELIYAAQNRLSKSDKAELEALNAKQQSEGLTPTEKQTLERLVQRYDQAVLLRAEALRILKERGHEISRLDLDSSRPASSPA